jgi:O-acetyl-ADP-ribose deacetylase (regulator of RNase III)
MITYIIGDATNPVGDGNKIICHCCNNIGKWGAGFTGALSKRWNQPELEFRRRYSEGHFELGRVQFVKVADDIVVANMIGQHGITWHDGVPPIRYNALVECLSIVANRAKRTTASIHAPRFGSALAGGKWETIERMINSIFSTIPVTIYDLP